MPPLLLFAEASASDFGMVILTIVNAVGGAFTFWVKAKYDARFTALEGDLKGCQEKHSASEQAATVALAEVAGLKKQNGEQQGTLDRLVSALHKQGLSAGSNSHAKLADDGTDEHTPVA